MSIALDIFCFPVPFTMIFSAVLSVATCFGGCEWPISNREVCMDVNLWQCLNNPPNYAYVADAMTLISMLGSRCTGPFYGGIACIVVLDFGPRKKYPPDLLCASGSDI